MNDVTTYIETMNELKDAINLPAIRAIQEQNAAIQNALRLSPSIQKAVGNSNGMYAALNTLAHRLGQLEINTDAMRSALSSMAYVSSSFQQQAFSNLTVKLQPILSGYTVLGIHPKDRKMEEQEKSDQIWI